MHQFLFGLDDQYRTVRSTLVSRTPIQPLEEIYNIVRQEEDMRVSNEEQPEVAAFAVQTKPRYKTDDKEKGVACKHCNRTGHNSENCYALIGYQEWWGDRPKRRTLNGRGRGASSSSGFVGGRGRGQVHFANRVYVPNIENQNTEQANYVLTENDRDGVNGLNEQQWKMLKSILNAGKEASSSSENCLVRLLLNLG